MIIYKITNLVNKKIYIGLTTRPLDMRINEHLSNAHRTKCMLISRAILKYGRDNFEFEMIAEYKTKEELIEAEKYWIDFYSSNNLDIGYNLTTGGDGGDIIGTLPNKLEIYKKRADSNRGTKRSEDCRKRISDANPNRGKKLSDEVKAKISNTLKGSKLSDETKVKISHALKGRIHTEETKKKMSKNMLGKAHPNARKAIKIEGITYDSLTEASLKLQIAASAIHYRLNSKKFIEYYYVKS